VSDQPLAPGDEPVVIELRVEEVRMLRTLGEQLRQRLQGPPDRVVQRLFPQVVRDDAALDRDARRLIHDDLMRERLARLEDVLGLLPDDGAATVGLVDDQPQLLMGLLNDLRLSLAVSVGLDQPVEERAEPDEATEQAAALMDWLAWWQERILRSIDPDALRFYEEESDLSA